MYPANALLLVSAAYGNYLKNNNLRETLGCLALLRILLARPRSVKQSFAAGSMRGTFRQYSAGPLFSRNGMVESIAWPDIGLSEARRSPTAGGQHNWNNPIFWVDASLRRCFHTTMTLANQTVQRILAIALAGLAAIAMTWQNTRPLADSPQQPIVVVQAPELEQQQVSIRPGDTLEGLLERSGVDAQLRMDLIAAVQKEFDVRKFRAGSQLTLIRTRQGALDSLEYVVDPDHRLQLGKSTEGFVAQIAEIPSAIRRTAICGTLRGSLFESLERTGERPELAMEMAEIFAWDLDFYRDPREGDEFCLLVEKKEYENGAPASYQRVLAAKYINDGSTYDAYLFESDDGSAHYYSSDGESLQAAFLRSPLAFDARISSRYSARRFHPVLGQYRPHLGTDYAAPTGTPILAVADGRVVFSGRSGGSGNMVTLQHANGFETQYLHMSRRIVSQGKRVRQGERIGLVGATGLATGPHVDIRIRKNGRYMNWEKLKVPRQSRIAAAKESAFNAARDAFAAQMAAGYDSNIKLASSDQSPETAP